MEKSANKLRKKGRHKRKFSESSNFFFLFFSLLWRYNYLHVTRNNVLKTGTNIFLFLHFFFKFYFIFSSNSGLFCRKYQLQEKRGEKEGNKAVGIFYTSINCYVQEYLHSKTQFSFPKQTSVNKVVIVFAAALQTRCKRCLYRYGCRVQTRTSSRRWRLRRGWRA